MIVIVTGGRDKRDMAAAFAHLDRIDAERGITVVAEGGQRTREKGIPVGGADYFAFMWAVERGKAVRTFFADWTRHGKSAGPRRNRRMLAEMRPDFVINMSGGRGTADMVGAAGALGIEVIDAPID